jgi:hypothetical protein
MIAQASRDGHIRPALDNRLQQLPNRINVVGIVGINHDESVGIDLLKHCRDHMPFALPLLVTDDGARFGCDARGIVR